MRRVAVCSLVVLSVIGSGAAGAKKDPPPAGTLVFVRDQSVERAPLSDPEASETVTELAITAPIVAMSAAADGSAVLIDFGRNALWIDLGEPTMQRLLPCLRGQLSASGDRVVCGARTGDGAVVYSMRGDRASWPRPTWNADASEFVDGDGRWLVTATSAGLVKMAVDRTADRQVVTDNRPSGGLSIAPDGLRAVARYPVEGKELESLYTFRLTDGDARRKLVPGQPVAWSADSKWLAIDGNKEGCVVRAVGGEYKCWRRYRSLALTGDGSHLLMARPNGEGDDDDEPASDNGTFDIYLGRTAGVRSARPPRLVSGVRAATLIP